MTRTGLILSALLHVAVLLFLFSARDFNKKSPSFAMRPLPLKVLPIKDKTNLPTRSPSKKTPKKEKKTPLAPPKAKKELAKKIEKKEESKKTADKPKNLPSKPQKETPAQPKEIKNIAPAAPEKKKEKQKPSKETKKKEKESPKKEKDTSKKSKGKETKDPAKKEKKKEEDDFLAVLKTVENLESPKEDKTKGLIDSRANPDESKNIEDLLSLSELDALRQQLSSCWRLPAGAQAAADLAIHLRVTMNPDATVQKVHLENEEESGKSPFFKAAYESAKRALFHPHCTPLKLPQHKYDQWRQFSITFDPKEMII